MKNIAILGAVVALGFGGAAHAADLGVVQAPATYSSASQFDWTGFYAGINGGYGWADVSVAGFKLMDGEGTFGGLQVGYNHDFGDFVFGVEADAQLSGIKDNGGFAYTLDNFGTVRARAGWSVDRFLPYVTGGLSWGNATAVGAPQEHETYIGWAAGAGLEVAVTEQLSVKGEYLYLDFGGAGFGAGGLDLDLKAHVVRAGLNYKF